MNKIAIFYNWALLLGSWALLASIPWHSYWIKRLLLEEFKRAKLWGKLLLAVVVYYAEVVLITGAAHVVLGAGAVKFDQRIGNFLLTWPFWLFWDPVLVSWQGLSYLVVALSNLFWAMLCLLGGLVYALVLCVAALWVGLFVWRVVSRPSLGRVSREFIGMRARIPYTSS